MQTKYNPKIKLYSPSQGGNCHIKTNKYLNLCKLGTVNWHIFQLHYKPEQLFNINNFSEGMHANWIH